MAALTADRNTPCKDGELIPFAMGANAKIFAGSIVVANATGFAVAGLTSATVTYLGCANESANNVGGADGAKTVLVRRKKAFKFNNLAGDLVTQADIGKTCYIVDDQTVAKTNGGNTRSIAGKVLAVEVDGVWIE